MYISLSLEYVLIFELMMGIWKNFLWPNKWAIDHFREVFPQLPCKALYVCYSIGLTYWQIGHKALQKM